MATQEYLDKLARGIGYWKTDMVEAEARGNRKLAAYYRKQIKQAEATIERNRSKNDGK